MFSIWRHSAYQVQLNTKCLWKIKYEINKAKVYFAHINEKETGRKMCKKKQKKGGSIK
jgi:hypothetical protein